MVDARKHWDGDFYCNGKYVAKSSFDDPFFVRYVMVRTDEWRVASKEVIEEDEIMSASSGTPSPATPQASDENRALVDGLMVKSERSGVMLEHRQQAFEFAEALAQRLDQFRTANSGVTEDSMRAALQRSDAGDRLNSVVQEVWEDWTDNARQHGFNAYTTDPGGMDFSPSRQLTRSLFGRSPTSSRRSFRVEVPTMQSIFRSRSILVILILGSMALIIIGLASNVAAQTTAEPLPTQAPIVHTVRAGESLSLIVEEYGVTVEQIVDANGLQDRHFIRAGQQLLIPSAAAETPSPTALAHWSNSDASLLACPQNTQIYALDLPAEPIRLAISGNQIYLVADGDLYRMPIPDSKTSERLTPANLMPPERRVGTYFIRELVYVAADTESGDLLLLDKSNDVYRYTNNDEWHMESPASQIPGQFPDPQFLAIQPDGDEVYALDADLQHIWLLGDGPPRSHLSRSGLNDAVDMAVSPSAEGPVFHILNRNGTVAQHQAGSTSRILAQFLSSANAWPSQILVQDDYLYVVDGETRDVHRIHMDDAQSLQIVEHRLPGMRRLRGIAVDDETLYALAGSNLYAVELDSAEEVACPPTGYDNAYTFYGIDLLGPVLDVQMPSADVTLLMRPRSYPGARRLYRQGIHRGLDIYGLEAPGLGIGTPVRAMADGVAIHVDADYEELTPDEYEAAVSRTEIEHRTPPDLMEQFQGRQVRIDHGNGIQSRYSHLASTASGLEVGDVIAQGDIIGTVGVSGTSSGAYGSSGGAHLHFEIWIDDNYLGHGLSLYETMRIWQALFSPSNSLAIATSTPISTSIQGRATVTPAQSIAAAPTAIPTPIPTTTPTASHACQRPPDDYSSVMLRGQTINARTLWMLNLADSLYEGRGDPLRVVQGSYSDDVEASFGTHAGGGAVDISIRVKANPEHVMGIDEAEDLVLALRRAGFAAWLRLPDDLKPPATLHIHAIAVGDEELSESAQAQITGPYGYFAGLDGVPPEHGGPKPDRYGGPYLCDWMEVTSEE